VPVLPGEYDAGRLADTGAPGHGRWWHLIALE
jgi:hypothetical protein